MPDTVLTNMEAPVFRNRSAEIKDLACALVKAQSELSGAKKGAKAVVTGTTVRTYADLASVWEAIREPLTDNGLCVIQFPRTVGNGVEIETTLMHGATGQFMSDVLWVPCGKNDAQGLGSAITYGRRYALMAVVGVCPVDDDGAAATASYKAAPGTAGAGTQFRPERRSPGMAQTESLRVDPADRDMVQGDGRSQYEADKAKKAAPRGGREATAEEALAVKITNAVNKRVDALKAGSPWTRDGLDQFWKGDKKWIDWMSDANNKQLAEYERFTTAFSDAEMNTRPVELA